MPQRRETGDIHIVHVETGRHLYGGARQVLLLMQGLEDRGRRGTLVCPAGSDIETAARTRGLGVHGMAMHGDADVGFTGRLARLLRRLRPDLVHVHSRRGADTFGGLAARLAGIPAVLSRRVDRLDPRGFGRLKYTQFRRVIAISACIRDQLAAGGVPAAKLRLVHSAVPAVTEAEGMSREAFHDRFGLPADAFPIAVVAQLIPRKGHRFFIDALAALLDTHSEIRAVMFGIGPLKAELVAQVNALGLDEHVRFAGFEPELGRWLGHFELLVHPAEREGLGIAVLEAQAAGVPVVGCRAGGLAEAVADGETGMLVTPGDVSALASAIRGMIEDEPRRHRFAAAGPERVRRAFGVDAMVEGNLAVYGEIVNGHMG